MKIPINFGSYKARSEKSNSSRCVNMHPVVDVVGLLGYDRKSQGNLEQVSFNTCSGSRLFCSTTSPEVRGMYNYNGTGYFVAGSTLYSVSVNGNLTTLGTLSSSQGEIKMRSNSTQLMIINKGTTEGYIWTYPVGSTAGTLFTIQNMAGVGTAAILAGGSGYVSPTATIAAPQPGGVQATMTIGVSSGELANPVITEIGSGYSTEYPATVTITDSAGTGGVVSLSLGTPTYPGAEDLEQMDGYFIVVWQGSFYLSTLNDGTEWPALNVITPGYQSDKLRALGTVKDNLVLIQDLTTQVYYNDGSSPFARNPGYSVRYGTRAKRTCLILDESLFMLAQSKDGYAGVIRMSANQQITPISTESVDYQFSTYSTVEDAFAISYREGQHQIYQITFPSADKTWCYDLSTQAWFERESPTIDGMRVGRHFANNCMYLGEKTIMGDYQSGKLYVLDQTTFQERGVQLVGYTDTLNLNQDEQWITIASAEVSMGSGKATATGNGSNPQLTLMTSRNNRPYKTERYHSIGKVGEYGKRVIYKRVGIARNWRFRLQYADPTPMEAIRIIAHGAIGTI